MTGEVAPCQFGQRGFGIDWRPLTEPLVDEHELLLPSPHGTTYDQAPQRAVHEYVDEGLPRGRDTCPFESRTELGSSSRPLIGDLCPDGRLALLRLIRAHPLLLQAPQVEVDLPGCGDLMEPRVVLASDQVKGAAVEPGDDHRAIIEGGVDVGGAQSLGAGPDRQPRAPRILCLDGKQATDHVIRTSEWASAQPLGGESLDRGQRFISARRHRSATLAHPAVIGNRQIRSNVSDRDRPGRSGPIVSSPR